MKILVCYDGTEIGQDVIKLAKKHAKAFKGEVVIFTSLVVDDPAEMKR